ncbi:MAG: agmatinase [Candidatus Bathyarchaeota archaeon]|nr:agmatinase [Candidatus Bathyarchaeota archaeon]MDH5792635.1 agmatinase [Candidatus Bathyarchaeota archaeon]
MKGYRPVDPRESPRFAGIKTFMRLPHVKTTEGVDVAIVGVPFDTGASYRVGARFGPEAIRNISALLRHHNEVLDVSIFDHCSVVDYGDLPVNPGYIEDSYKMIEEGLLPILEGGVTPIMLGGDHSVTLPELRAVAKRHGPVALIHFDSHSDTGDKRFGRRYTHGTPFRRAIEEELILVDNSIQAGMRGSIYSRDSLDDARKLGFDLVTSVEAQEQGIDELIRRIRERAGDAKAFVSFDIDFVDPAYAPGTGTPEVGGFTSSEALRVVRGLKGLDLIGFDLVEVLPQHDPSQITALLAANIVYEFISLIALRNKLASEG